MKSLSNIDDKDWVGCYEIVHQKLSHQVLDLRQGGEVISLEAAGG